MRDEHRDPQTGELFNDYRADRAQAALDAYIEFTGDSPDESHFRDLLCDLRHLAARDGAGDSMLDGPAGLMTFDEALEISTRCYEDEVYIEREKEWPPLTATIDDGDNLLINEPVTGAPIPPPDDEQVADYQFEQGIIPVPSQPEIERMLVVTTAHLTEHTCNSYLHSYTGPAWEKGDYGWFVYVVEDTSELPVDLKHCLEYARGQGCFWVMFDRDASEIDGMPTYDW